MTAQWIGLIAFTVTLLPIGLAMAANRVPERLRLRPAPVRSRGWALLLIYATAPVNAIPRLAGASPELTLICTAAGGVLAVAGMLLLGITAYAQQRGPVGDRPART
ncbi:hypothetical protein [Streptomyces sp. ISL-94]|uniref:hypothetical protein n=1 Tax=Streptomyces sp. ISL-94 TaxID=2819190 RepID=UPI001BEC4239|nr:hypothetical protein [Streptomyces sp. ISL-94]MBT2479668.1 hypothetical protein [Streptomyces sp. ISL-94]